MTTSAESATHPTTDATSNTQAGPVSNSGGPRFTVGISERLGNCMLFADCSGPIPFMTWVGLYANSLPGNPNSNYLAWFWLTPSQTSLQTDLRFGSGYRAAVVVLTGSQAEYTPDTSGTPVSTNACVSQFSLSITEKLGCRLLSASRTSGPIPYGTWVALYAAPLPPDANSNYLADAWFYLTPNQTSLQTNYPFGNGYVAAIVILTESVVANGTYIQNTWAYGPTVGPT